MNDDINKALTEHEVFIFGMDDEIYPAKDYLLQVYYLFAQFMEYTLQIPSAEILQFMTKYYQSTGEEGLFPATADAFSIPDEFHEKFQNLHQTARLPLKLLLYKEALDDLKKIAEHNKILILLSDGNPAIQLNKIRQTEWNGLEPLIKVYFIAEMEGGSTTVTDYFAKLFNVPGDRVYQWRRNF